MVDWGSGGAKPGTYERMKGVIRNVSFSAAKLNLAWEKWTPYPKGGRVDILNKKIKENMICGMQCKG